MAVRKKTLPLAQLEQDAGPAPVDNDLGMVVRRTPAKRILGIPIPGTAGVEMVESGVGRRVRERAEEQARVAEQEQVEPEAPSQPMDVRRESEAKRVSDLRNKAMAMMAEPDATASEADHQLQ